MISQQKIYYIFKPHMSAGLVFYLPNIFYHWFDITTTAGSSYKLTFIPASDYLLLFLTTYVGSISLSQYCGF